ncbi:MAG: PQQ-dependent sugar dehydrogenase [Chitinophagales bacterium]
MKKRILLLLLLSQAVQADIKPIVRDSTHTNIWGMACHNTGLYFTEMGGKFYRQTEDTTVLLLHKLVSPIGQVGLLDVVMTERTGKLYALLSMVDVFDRFLVQEYRVEGNVAILERTLFDIAAYHQKMGGRLEVANNGVFVSVGVGNTAAQAQDLTVPYGKIWFIDLITGNAYIYATGFRNVQGLTIDSHSNLYSSEHGNIGGDEINLVLEGENYGYGAADSLITVPPLLEFAKAPSGAVFYEGDYLPNLTGRIVVAQLKGKAVMASDLITPAYPIYMKNEFGRFRDVCACTDGRVYVSTSNNDLYGAGGTDYIIELQPKIKLQVVLEGGQNDSLQIDYFTDGELTGEEQVWLADSSTWIHPPNGITHIVVRHSNHIDVVTDAPFSTTIDAGVLLAGDADSDEVITVHDFNLFQSGVLMADFNGDGELTVADFNLYFKNLGVIGDSKVRD